GIADVAESELNTRLVGRDCNTAASFGEIEAGDITPTLKKGRRQHGSECPGAAAGRKQIAQFCAGGTCHTGQCDVGEKSGASSANIGVGGPQLVFRSNDVWPMNQQVGGKSDGEIRQ